MMRKTRRQMLRRRRMDASYKILGDIRRLVGGDGYNGEDDSSHENARNIAVAL
jgi:hypothetical protein